MDFETEIKETTMNIEIYTDGACRGNQFNKNLGAWAYYKDRYCYAKGIQENTTNNIMELTAVIKALEMLALNKRFNDKITIYSDSTYVIMGINVWYKGWIKKNWKGVKNVELWKKLLTEKMKFARITFQHIPGHSGNIGNETVDKLCNEAMDKYEKEQT